MKFHQLQLKNKNYYFREILGFLFLLLAIYFFRHQAYELKPTEQVLSAIKLKWIVIGPCITLLYLVIQGWLYVCSFETAGARIKLWAGIKLFLRRNLSNTFLPNNEGASLAFCDKELEKNDSSKAILNFSFYIYSVTSFLAILLIVTPGILWLIFTLWFNTLTSLWCTTATFATLLIIIAISIKKQNLVYKWLLSVTPGTEVILREVFTNKFSLSTFLKTVGLSLSAELFSMAFLFISILTVGKLPSLEVIAASYIITRLSIIISPFIKGLGAVELSLTLFFKYIGYNTNDAICIVLLYRMLELGLPVFYGAISFLFFTGDITFKVLSTVLLFVLGLINVLSVLTPSLKSTKVIVTEFLPVPVINISNYIILLTGILLIVITPFIMRGLRTAWFSAVFLCIVSLLGHLTRAFDYEKSLLALLMLVALLLTQRKYDVRTNPKLQGLSLGTSLWMLITVAIYGITGFYFLAQPHFGISFTLASSIINTLSNFILLNSPHLIPHTRFAELFLYSIKLFGISGITLVIYTLLKPFILERSIEAAARNRAQRLLEKYGRSPVDYFKTYSDKLLFFSNKYNGFIAYRVANNFAIVLEEPVCEDSVNVRSYILKEFERFCLTLNIKPAYYRVDGMSLDLFGYLGKKWMLIGQEAILDLSCFSICKKEFKSVCSALNNIHQKGFNTKVYETPVNNLMQQKLKQVSDEWLKSMHREELVFSQGVFNWDELKKQTIITLENQEGKILAFLNVIPDYAAGEATYDLIRKTKDAPVGNMDVLMVELINYCQQKGYKYLNLGLAPMADIESAENTSGQTVKFAFNQIQQFKYNKDLRDFKQQFDPYWRNKYLVYENTYDLLQLPLAISKVMKP